MPISSYPGVNGFSPDISLSYNSQQPKSNIGVGWRISGLSEIKRAGVDIYYDGHTRGIEMSNNDSFLLDGMRLIKLIPLQVTFNMNPSKATLKQRDILSEIS